MPWEKSELDDNVWMGVPDIVILYDPDQTAWQPLYHEEDYQGIADQILAERLGLTKEKIT